MVSIVTTDNVDVFVCDFELSLTNKKEVNTITKRGTITVTNLLATDRMISSHHECMLQI